MSYLSLLQGTILLTLGRKVFWLFVGVLGYSAGLQIASQTFAADTSQMLAIMFGIIAAALAVFLKKIMIALAGFAAGALVTSSLLAILDQNLGGISSLLIILGGIIGIGLMIGIFDWAVIILSSLYGAGVVVGEFSLNNTVAIAAFIVLSLIGISIQGKFLRQEE